ncbi:MAG: hypothetical protein KAT15_22940 [Bacteroidales bacterium]|nr:hypothetical protein [Bacteroidales bacterium]
MKKPEIKNDPGFRDLTFAEIHEYKGGLCILPSILGQKVFDWLRERI